MRPAIHTRRQARQRFQSALNSLNDLWRVRNTRIRRGEALVPDDAVVGLGLARSGIKQALTAYSTEGSNGNSSTDAGK